MLSEISDREIKYYIISVHMEGEKKRTHKNREQIGGC